MAATKLSVVVPCYNEEKNIPLVLDRFKEAIDKTKFGAGFELILVDNNSKDNSAKVLKKELAKKEYKFAKTVFQPTPGYGAALGMGITSAKGEYVCWTHADLQTDPADTIKAYRILQRQPDKKKAFVKGTRRGRPFMDTFFTFGMTVFESVVLQTSMNDINAQPNLFHRDFLKLMKNPPTDFSFDLYAFYLAKKHKYRVIRFKVFFPPRIHGESSWNTGFGQKFKFIKRTISFTSSLKQRLKEEDLMG